MGLIKSATGGFALVPERRQNSPTSSYLANGLPLVIEPKGE